MKAVFAIFLSLFVSMAFADARIDQPGGVCHVPIDNANVDNEFFLRDCASSTFQDNGRVAGFMVVEQYGVRSHILPTGLRPINGPRSVATDWETSGTACTLIDGNGTEVTATEWWADVNTTPNEFNPDLADIRYTLRCVLN